MPQIHFSLTSILLTHISNIALIKYVLLWIGSLSATIIGVFIGFRLEQIAIKRDRRKAFNAQLISLSLELKNNYDQLSKKLGEDYKEETISFEVQKELLANTLFLEFVEKIGGYEILKKMWQSLSDQRWAKAHHTRVEFQNNGAIEQLNELIHKIDFYFIIPKK